MERKAMKAVILAGGFAKRMWPLTRDRPKVLLPLAGRPMLEHVLEKVEQLEGIDRIFITTNSKFEAQFREWLSGFGSGKGVEIVVEPPVREEEKLGSIGALRNIIESENLDDDLLIIGGDNLFGFSLADFVDYYREKGGPVFALYDMGDPERVRGRFGVPVLGHGNRIVGFQEKPQEPRSTFVSTAVYLLPRSVLPMVSEYLDSGNNPDAFGFFIAWLHKRLDVFGFVSREKWFDIGSSVALREPRSP